MNAPSYDKHGVVVFAGDCTEILPTLDADSVDAVVTDAPYELGFMGKGWDAAGVAYSVPMWRECLRVLKPGGYLLSFGGTRTYHRMACAVEDAGFDIRDTIMWLYGSGFPKGKAQLKPAHEPIVVARKPAPGPWLNVDACRINSPVLPSDHRGSASRTVGGLGGIYSDGWSRPAHQDAAGSRHNPSGRWPSNVVLTHADTCDDACVGGCPIAELDRQTEGTRAQKGTTGCTKGSGRSGLVYGSSADYTRPTAGDALVGYEQGGSASRFFPVFRYQPKAPKRERPVVDGVAHATVKPLALMRWLVRLVTPPGGIVLDPFAGSGTTLQAARDEGFSAVGIEREATYLPLIVARLDRTPDTGELPGQLDLLDEAAS